MATASNIVIRPLVDTVPFDPIRDFTPVAPDLPTVAEAGVPGYEVTQWSGVLGPARLPKAIVAKLNAEIERILARPQIRDRLVGDGAQPGGGAPERFGAYIKAEVAKWTKVIKAAKLDAPAGSRTN